MLQVEEKQVLRAISTEAGLPLQPAVTPAPRPAEDVPADGGALAAGEEAQSKACAILDAECEACQ